MWIGKAGSPTTAVSPGPSMRQAQVAEAFLRADRGDDLGLRVELDAVLVLVFLGHLLAQAGDAVADAVAVVARVDGRLAELVDDALGRGVGGVAHPQVDDVDARHALLVLHLVDAPEQVRRQALDAGGDVDLEGLLTHICFSGKVLSCRRRPALVDGAQYRMGRPPGYRARRAWALPPGPPVRAPCQRAGIAPGAGAADGAARARHGHIGFVLLPQLPLALLLLADLFQVLDLLVGAPGDAG